MMNSETTTLPEGYKPGLEGVVAGTSAISEVNSAIDTLSYRGYAAHELAAHASYEEVAYLLLYEKLPTRAELNQFSSELARNRELPAQVLATLKLLPPKANTMLTLSACIAVMGILDPDLQRNDRDANLGKARRLISKAPTLVAAISRNLRGLDIIAPDPALGHAANFYYMITGKKPEPEVARVLNATMVLYAEHGFNASTFAALVTSSTLSDMHSAVVSAIGALKGPLHGGANEGAINLLLSIRDEKDVDAWLKKALERKEKIMGFGHRVYKKQDSRAPIMKQLAAEVARKLNDTWLYPLSEKLETAMHREKNLFPNVDYHCAVVYYLFGLPIEIYTAMFAVARMAGWTAHIIEQHGANRLIRPGCFYTGARNVPYVPIEKR